MSSYLVVDGGQTGCRAVFFEDHVEVGRGTGPGYSHYAPEGPLEAMLQAFETAVVEVVDRPTAVEALCLGLTGFGGSPEQAGLINQRMRRIVATDRLILTNDSVTAYIGALGFRPGVVAVAGTGVIVLAVDEEGRHSRCDGWGYILGDSGSGFAIGREGLANALRAEDGRGGSSELQRRARDRYGSLVGLPRQVYTAANPVSMVAGFAEDVAGAAEAGDATAASIWANAAVEIAASTVAAARTIFTEGESVVVSWTGRLFHAEDLLTEPFQRHVLEQWPAAHMVPHQGTPIDGGRLLASSLKFPMFDDLIHVFNW